MIVEITERKRQERAARLTAAVSELLAASPDLDAVLARAASLMVPELADSCALYLLPRTDVARRLAITNVDAALGERLLDADRRWPLDIPRLLASSPELRSGKPVMVTTVTDEMRSAFPSIGQPSSRQVVCGRRHSPHVGDDIVGSHLDYTGESAVRTSPTTSSW
jgi:hypothetical protein